MNTFIPMFFEIDNETYSCYTLCKLNIYVITI